MSIPVGSEHGAVWITYDPARIDGAALSAIELRAAGVPYTLLSPYPGLQTPISVQRGVVNWQ